MKVECVVCEETLVAMGGTRARVWNYPVVSVEEATQRATRVAIMLEGAGSGHDERVAASLAAAGIEVIDASGEPEAAVRAA